MIIHFISRGPFDIRNGVECGDRARAKTPRPHPALPTEPSARSCRASHFSFACCREMRCPPYLAIQ